jgi:GNAT superfamily N-acetyltransferase
MQPAAALAERPTTSVPGTRKLEFRWVSFGQLAREFLPLFKQHWREIALNQDDVPLDPDWDRYFQYDLAGILQVLTVWDGEVLVGYIFMLVYHHLHYASTKWATSDMFWLHPAYRTGWTGSRMFRQMELRMRLLKVTIVMVNYKLHFENERGGLARFFEWLGYKHVENVVAKKLT